MLGYQLADRLANMDGETKSPVFPGWLRTLTVGRRPKWTLVRITILVLTVFILVKFIVIPIQVKGISMYPTYKDGSINLINRLAYRHATPKRGDVVGIRFQSGRSFMYMKRVIGLPGETVAFKNGVLYINDQPMPEPYLKYPYRWYMAPVHLGANLYYVVGDNRTMSIEDHYQGKADLVTEIVGKVIFGGKS